MADRDRELLDMAYAFAIGALVGVGAVLLLREDRDDRAGRVIRQLRQKGVRAHRASRRVSRDLAEAVEWVHRSLSRS